MIDQPVGKVQARRSWMQRSARLIPVAVIVLALSIGDHSGAPTATAAVRELPAPPANGEIGFVVTQFYPSFHNGGDDTDCPDGMVGTLKNSYLRTLPNAERARLSKPENANVLDKLWKEYGMGPDETNICANMLEYLDRPAVPTMQGNVAWGLNLDGDDGDGSNDPYTCKHENFTSPTGEKGIDYQIWRAQGCSALLRGVNNDGESDLKFAYNNNMMNGEWSQVILLRGVDSFVRDDDVEIVYANTEDRPVADTAGNPIHNASFTVSTSGRRAEYRNVLKGRIVNGVLTTTPDKILLDNSPSQFNLDRGRVRLELQADGSIKGVVGGYQPLANIMRAQRGGGRGSVQVAGIDCAGEFVSIMKLADGDRDPETGQCRKISYSYDLVAVPAFVNDAPKRNIASK